MTKSENPPRCRLLCTTWTKFTPESGLSDLPQTAVGATRFADYLTQTGALADLPTIMTDVPGIACLNAIEDLLARDQNEDGIIVYLSSHGLTPTSAQQLYRLATGDTRQTDDLLRSLPIDEIVKKLKTSKASIKWLIVDACFSGRAGTSLMAPTPRARPPKVDNLCILASSDPFSSSLAPVGQELTAFTQGLVDVLREGDPQAVGLRTIGEIYEGIRLKAEAKGHPVPYLLGQGLTTQIRFIPNGHAGELAADDASASLKELTKYDHRAEILFVDDDVMTRDIFKQDLEASGHAVTTVGTPDEARQMVETKHYDIIVVDLFLVGDLPASELITYLSRTAAESLIFVASRQSKGKQEESWTTLSGVFQYPHRVAAFLFKDSFMDTVTLFADRIRARRSFVLSHIDGLEQWVPFVSGRMTRRHAVAMELGPDLDVQTRVCVEQLVSRWFDRGSSVTDYIHSMSMEPIDSGRSSCSVFSLTPHVHGVTPIAVNPLLLKIGARAEIREEVDRYDKFVQIGVPLELRTDKVSFAEVGSVAAVLYSFLSESDGSIAEVGELDTDAIAECMETIFDPERKRWYASVGAGEGVRLLNFFAERKYDLGRFAKVAQTMDTSLRGMDASVGRITRDLCEYPVMNVRQPATLVHGDLHLGNILKYGEKRYAMIDYRNVGIGPRLTDFITLEIACWLLAPAPETARSKLMEQAYRAVSGGGLWHEAPDVEPEPWLRDSIHLVKRCRNLARLNFPDMTATEYGCLLWLSSVRRFEFQSTATTAQEKRTMRVMPIALALAAQELIGA